MSSIVSRRPSSRNHLNDAFWMSIRFGRSSTCSRRENDLRARGEATFVVKEKASLGDVRNQRIQACGNADERNVGATRQGTYKDPFTASDARGRLPVSRATVACRPPYVQGGRPGGGTSGALKRRAPDAQPFAIDSVR